MADEFEAVVAIAFTTAASPFPMMMTVTMVVVMVVVMVAVMVVAMTVVRRLASAILVVTMVMMRMSFAHIQSSCVVIPDQK